MTAKITNATSKTEAPLSMSPSLTVQSFSDS
jgi:hypothetical protein